MCSSDLVDHRDVKLAGQAALAAARSADLAGAHPSDDGMQCLLPILDGPGELRDEGLSGGGESGKLRRDCGGRQIPCFPVCHIVSLIKKWGA